MQLDFLNFIYDDKLIFRLKWLRIINNLNWITFWLIKLLIAIKLKIIFLEYLIFSDLRLALESLRYKNIRAKHVLA